MEVRREVAPIVTRNRGRSGVADALSALRAEQLEQQAALLRDGGPGGGGPDGRVKVGWALAAGVLVGWLVGWSVGWLVGT